MIPRIKNLPYAKRSRFSIDIVSRNGRRRGVPAVAKRIGTGMLETENAGRGGQDHGLTPTAE